MLSKAQRSTIYDIRKTLEGAIFAISTFLEDEHVEDYNAVPLEEAIKCIDNAIGYMTELW